MKELVEYITKNIVQYPEKLEIQETEVSTGNNNMMKHVKVTIKSADEDKPLIIGKGGRTIKSIRNLSKIKAIKDNIYLEVVLED